MNQIQSSRGRVLPALVASLVTALAVGAFSSAVPAAHAQNIATGQQVASSTLSIAAGTPAAIVTGVSGKKIVVTAMRLTASAGGGLVTFYDGTATTTPLFNAYVPTSTTSFYALVDIPATFLGNAWPTQAGINGVVGGIGTAGNSLCAQLNGCTLNYSVTYYLQ